MCAVRTWRWEYCEILSAAMTRRAAVGDRAEGKYVPHGHDMDKSAVQGEHNGGTKIKKNGK